MTTKLSKVFQFEEGIKQGRVEVLKECLEIIEDYRTDRIKTLDGMELQISQLKDKQSKRKEK